jgi:hypothetical protein
MPLYFEKDIVEEVETHVREIDLPNVSFYLFDMQCSSCMPFEGAGLIKT